MPRCGAKKFQSSLCPAKLCGLPNQLDDAFVTGNPLHAEDIATPFPAMPPSIPRAAVPTSSLCPSCSRAANPRRWLSSTATLSHVGPESPRYIEVPKLPQARAHYKPPVKGVLPVPREIFPRGAPNKASPVYLVRATPEPDSQRKAPTGPGSSRLAWKERMAEVRRKNLREGIMELQKRKRQTDRYFAERGARRQAEQKALISQPERDDELLTQSSISVELRDILEGRMKVHGPDPAKLQESAAKYEAKAKDKEAWQMDSLHTLYMQAKDFITTEAQLDAAVEEAFGTEEMPKRFGALADGLSMWDVAKPDTVAELLRKANTDDTSTGGDLASLRQERLKVIAEQLTGGKIWDHQKSVSDRSVY